MNQPLIRLTGISAAYDQKKVLENVNLEIAEKDFLGVIGPNGGGKSTLAKVLSNLSLNDKVELLGENISKISDLKRTQLINYIPPKLSIFDEYVTLREFLELSSIDLVDNEKINKINIINFCRKG